LRAPRSNLIWMTREIDGAGEVRIALTGVKG
jgi:hypothetical protein